MAKPTVDILYPAEDGNGDQIVVVAKSIIVAWGCAPKKAGGVKGTLLQGNNPVANCQGIPGTQFFPSQHPLCHRWFIVFNDLSKLVSGDVTLHVDPVQANGVESDETGFSYQKLTAQVAKGAKQAKAAKVAFVPSITPDPPLSGTTVLPTFSSSGSFTPGTAPLFAYIQQDGGQPCMGLLTLGPSPNFVFQFNNVPAGAGYTIYYSDSANPATTNQDANITVQGASPGPTVGGN
jgi:hypothetical protein